MGKTRIDYYINRRNAQMHRIQAKHNAQMRRIQAKYNAKINSELKRLRKKGLL